MNFCLRLFGAALLGAPFAVLAQTQPAPAFAPTLAACFASQSALTPFSGLVLAQRGRDSFLQIAGTVDGGRAPGRDTPYRLASVGKVFTEVAIGQLVDRGRIRLDAPIGTYLPDLPPALAAVTVEQLILHRSGISGDIMLTPEMAATMQRARSARDLLPLVVNRPLAFAPGTQTQYSNGGYFVLGAIIEAVSGRTYADYLRGAIFRPLGMTRSGVAANPRAAPSMSRMQGPGQPLLDRPALVRGLPDLPGTSAGDSISTADDLARLARALLGHRLLSDATKARIFPRRGNVWRIGQGGGRPGANTYFMLFPESDAALIVLTNYDPPAGELMGETLGGLLSGQPCHPLSEADRPSPMRIIGPPQAPRPHV